MHMKRLTTKTLAIFLSVLIGLYPVLSTAAGNTHCTETAMAMPDDNMHTMHHAGSDQSGVEQVNCCQNKHPCGIDSPCSSSSCVNLTCVQNLFSHIDQQHKSKYFAVVSAAIPIAPPFVFFRPPITLI